KRGITFEEGVADKLVKELLQIKDTTETGTATEVTGEFVEPVQLQVVCQELWSRVKDADVVTYRHIAGLDVGRALSRFYEEGIQKAVAGSKIGEEGLREWFEKYLVTPLGTRGLVIQGQQFTGEVPNEAVTVLEDHHLIRSEKRAGANWYELTHDRLI